MRLAGRLCQENILHHQEVQVVQRLRGPRAFRCRVCAHDEEGLQRSLARGLKHLRVRQSRLLGDFTAPIAAEPFPCLRVRHRNVPRQPVGQDAHVARALAVGLRTDVGHAVSANQQAQVVQRGRVGFRGPTTHYVRAIQHQGILGLSEEVGHLGEDIGGRAGPIHRVGKFCHPRREVLAPGETPHLCREPIRLDHAGYQRVEQLRLCARHHRHVEPKVRVLGPPRVDDHGLGSTAPHRSLEEVGQHRVIFGQVNPHQDDQIRVMNLLDGSKAVRIGQHVAASAMVDVVRVHHQAEEFLQQVVGLVTDLWGPNGAHRFGFLLSPRVQPVHHPFESLIPGRRTQLAVFPHQGLRQTLLMVEEALGKATLVTNPHVIDRGVLPGHDAAHRVRAHVNAQVAPLGTVDTDAGNFLQIARGRPLGPGAEGETGHPIGQRPHRADINNVAAGLGRQPLFRVNVNDRLVAPMVEP